MSFQNRSWTCSLPAALLLLAPFDILASLAMDIYLPVVPTMPEALGTSATVVQLTLSLYMLLLGAGQMLFGPLSDRIGRRPVLLGGALLFAASSLLLAATSSATLFVLLRLLQAAGASAALVATFATVRDVYAVRPEGAVIYSLLGAILSFVPALGPVAGAVIADHFGWRAIFLCGLVPVAISALILMWVKEPEQWERKQERARRASPLATIFNARYRKRTIVNAALLTVAIIGLWAGAVYEPTAIVTLAKKEGYDALGAAHMVSYGTAILSIGTILGCLALPPLAERAGRKPVLAFYFIGMLVTIALAFGWAFYLTAGLVPFLVLLFFMGFAGGNFTMFSLWLPEQYETEVRATAFAFTTSVGRFIGAGVNFLLGAMVKSMGTLGTPVALTAIAFGIGLLIIPFGIETVGRRLPD